MIDEFSILVLFASETLLLVDFHYQRKVQINIKYSIYKLIYQTDQTKFWHLISMYIVSAMRLETDLSATIY